MDRVKLMMLGALYAADAGAGAGANATTNAAAPPKKKITRTPPPSEPVVTFGGIEMPPGPQGAARTVFPFADMSLGDMFFVAGRTAEKFQPYASKYSRSLAPKKFMSRDIAVKGKDGKPELKDGKPQLVDPTKDKSAVVGVGCWRTA